MGSDPSFLQTFCRVPKRLTDHPLHRRHVRAVFTKLRSHTRYPAAVEAARNDEVKVGEIWFNIERQTVHRNPP